MEAEMEREQMIHIFYPSHLLADIDPFSVVAGGESGIDLFKFRFLSHLSLSFA